MTKASCVIPDLAVAADGECWPCPLPGWPGSWKCFAQATRMSLSLFLGIPGAASLTSGHGGLLAATTTK